MSNLLLHPKTSAFVENIISQPPHALLITGPEGSGKSTLAHHITKRLLITDDLLLHPFVKILDAQKGEGIAQVREIRKFLSLKTTGDSAVRRTIIVENADELGTDAQNALLKILEEPPSDTVLFLTANHAQRLLVTIRSRVRSLQILPLTKDACMQIDTHSMDDIKRAHALSGGRAGSFIALLGTGDQHNLIEAVALAKLFLSQSTFERLSQVDVLAKDKDQTKRLLDGLEKCLHAAMRSAKNDSIRSVHTRLSCVTTAINTYDTNANIKLLLTSLAINL